MVFTTNDQGYMCTDACHIISTELGKSCFFYPCGGTSDGPFDM